MVIVLVCAVGMSTSLLMNRMEAYAEEGVEIYAYPIEDLEKKLNHADVVLVGPQIRYKFDKIKRMCEQRDIPAALINLSDYGKMDGANVMKQAVELYGKGSADSIQRPM